MRLIRWAIAGLALAGAIFWWLSRPLAIDQEVFAGLAGDPVNGAVVFWAGGCAACHADPEATDDAVPVLSGGYRIKSPFGTFVAPNISPSDAGIAGWSVADLGNALVAGVSPSGTHYYPSFPYTTYRRMLPQDVADLKAFMDGLPASDRPSRPHEIGFPFNIRRGLGLWKRVFMTPDWMLEPGDNQKLQRGRYLVEALGHCAECHTARGPLGGLDRAAWMGGAPNPRGKGKIPNLTPAALDWSERDIAYYLQTGFTPDYDSASGQMASVVQSTARLSPEDRAAMAAYLKAIAPIE